MVTESSPAPEMAQFEFFAGTWEGSGTFFAIDDSPAISQPVLRIDAGYRHRGYWFEQKFTWIEHIEPAPAGLDVVEATRIWGYDRARRQFVCEWFDNRGRRATVLSPGWQGDHLVTDTVIVHSGQEIRARETFIRQSDNEWKHLAELNRGGRWIIGEEQDLRRVSTA